METTARFTFSHGQRGSVSGFWWSGLLHQPLGAYLIDMPRPARGDAGCSGAAEDEWDHLWTDLGGEG